MLRSLLQKFDMVVIAIEKLAKDLTNLFLEEIMGFLLKHETRLQRRSTSLESAFQS